jgi:benzoate-CoA ligase family protein
MSDSPYAVVDARVSPPSVQIPRVYNAATDFIDRHLQEGRGDRIAVKDDGGEYSYRELALRVNRAGNALRSLGVQMEQRVMIAMLDSIDFVSMFWGAMKIGAVPVPVNTLLAPKDYAFLLADSRARVLCVSDVLWPKLEAAARESPFLDVVVVGSTPGGPNVPGKMEIRTLLETAESELEPAATTGDDVGFWLYSSGSTGTPKGAIHLHSHLVQTAALFARGVLGMTEDDLIFSAAKLFFAYGLGNAMTFPFHVGGTSVLMSERPTVAAVMRTLAKHRPTLFGGVPTLFASMLADGSVTREAGSPALRFSISAGEALPEHVGKRWKERFGTDILDGIGSTEMLHIFLSNRPSDIRYGTSGKAVPGYELKLTRDDGQPVPPGEEGALWVRGPSTCVQYWNQRSKSLATFEGHWTRTGDRYACDADGYYTYGGRADDMLKVGGIWVSPFEVESALGAHDAVLEAAVVGHSDAEGLIKPKAFVVLKKPESASQELSLELQAFVKGRLAPYKYPRWVEIVSELPKTATGKIQRYKLR